MLLKYFITYFFIVLKIVAEPLSVVDEIGYILEILLMVEPDSRNQFGLFEDNYNFNGKSDGDIIKKFKETYIDTSKSTTKGGRLMRDLEEYNNYWSKKTISDSLDNFIRDLRNYQNKKGKIKDLNFSDFKKNIRGFIGKLNFIKDRFNALVVQGKIKNNSNLNNVKNYLDNAAKNRMKTMVKIYNINPDLYKNDMDLIDGTLRIKNGKNTFKIDKPNGINKILDIGHYKLWMGLTEIKAKMERICL